MATTEQMQYILKKLEQAHPAEFFKSMDATQVGIGAVLRLLHEAEEPVTAGKISDVLKVSTARVAVLLKKMVAKGLIVKDQDSEDGRVTIVSLTEVGEETIQKHQDQMYAQLSRVIDVVGEDRILEFIAIANEIKAVAGMPDLDF